ncbi:MAG: c-type cytochrome [Rhodospirillales bacterium]|nr:c-type cytochrome [Rhodospirillales bacterium]MDP7424112.1 c-type cytochrome [Rhodospirillales bacterium]MDP7623797.1 c-type cytochrome [Rhodospirillales bacterium]
MAKAVGKVFIFLLLVFGVFNWVGYSVTELTGGEKKAAMTGAVEVTPEGGEAIYWGKGRCFTCHSVGDRGSAVRGPNHGQFGEKFPLPMGERAVERAKEREKKTGKKFTALDYLVESLAEPGAYVVKGYKNEMAVVYAPPISLSLDEIKATVAYLQSQGGEFDAAAINKPGEITQGFYGKIAVASAAGGGDPSHGKVVYEETCGDCHSLEGERGDVGPDLSTIGTKGLKFISEAILQPAKNITKGFETYVVVKKNGRKVVGLKAGEEDGAIELVTKDGDEVSIKKSDIKEITQDKLLSVMPDDLSEEMTVKDYQDVLSFMLMQKGKKK